MEHNNLQEYILEKLSQNKNWSDTFNYVNGKEIDALKMTPYKYSAYIKVKIKIREKLNIPKGQRLDRDNPDYYEKEIDESISEYLKENDMSSPIADIKIIMPDKIRHMESVAKYMKYNADRFGLDGNEMYVVGLLHDIGYLCSSEEHGGYGAILLSSMGLKEEYTDAIANHGQSPYTLPEEKRTPILRLLQEADMSIDKFGRIVGFSGRLEDIKNRYGKDSFAYKTAQDTVSYLKEMYRKENEMDNTENMLKYIKTNMGLIPYEDYLDIKAQQYGYDDYEELKSDGLCITVSESDIVYVPDKEPDKEPDEEMEME